MSDEPSGRPGLATLYTYETPAMPERMLAAAVIRQALSDVATHVARHGNVYIETTAAKDARDFLLNRLWKPGCTWNEMYLHDLLGAQTRRMVIEYCEGTKVRPMTGGTRLKRAPIATAVCAA